MDDGTRMRNDAYTLNTQNFSTEENMRLQECLYQNFGINTSLHKDKCNHRIYIPENSAGGFTKLIDGFTLPSMKYKLLLTP